MKARLPSEILISLPEMERTPAAYAFHRYQKPGVAYEAARESAYNGAKRAKTIPNVDSVHIKMCYARPCERFKEPVLDIQGIKRAHCYM